MVEIKIRNVNENDIKEITNIYKHYVLNEVCTFEEEVPSEEEMNKRRSIIVDKNFPYIVATTTTTTTTIIKDGANDITKEIVIGYAYASSFRPRAAYRFTVEDSIYIDINYQKLGVGSILLKELISQCKEKGFKEIIAVIAAGGPNQVGGSSIKLHKKFGFDNQHTLKNVGYKFNQFLDTVSLQLSL
ncbi:hypothetical protein DDB_G0271268 [Dictyostelium discoideum AX4]|uniref:N-acetyltransferase domain-containing protein n=1 Tax=Dictyostelium discoideum TaxID=44689 RepID=Q55BC6_DICDI|nr:hypothetical protein DDB_G0271268 [Dictyostelium discoideum AX4]EAL71764.1 hypothetical protein DDB_G0271268 [Dictyostelium discoideum AX4]|eukprot:XP_645686.1 hypothetical protein DDB_G0271268 [Dictyostelium discoideum AX4]